MITKSDLQILLFNRIKSLLPGYVSLVDEVSDILNISSDSAYRRIRNEKQLHLDEFMLLCSYFQISADELFMKDSSIVSFNYYKLNENSLCFEDYLQNIYNDLNILYKQENPLVYLIFNELNIFQILQIPSLAAFKLFFWSKSNLGFSGYKDSLFSMEHINHKTKKICNDLLELYIRVPTIELISTEVLSSMLKQLDFYYEAGFFKSIDDVKMLCDDMLNLLNHLKRQAELGYKFVYGGKQDGLEGNYMLYLNDLVIVDNTVITISDKSIRNYITNNVVNLLISDNKDFCDQNLSWAKNLIGKSTLISGAAERDRNKYFKLMRNQIFTFKNEI